MSDEQFKQLYNQANGQMPPEFKAFAAALLSSTYDEDKTTASAGLAIVTIDSSLIVQEFGMEIALGVMIAWLVSIVLVPSGIMLFKSFGKGREHTFSPMFLHIYFSLDQGKVLVFSNLEEEHLVIYF